MRLHEFKNPLRIYLAIVRVVLRSSSSTTRTTISADSSSNAQLMLSRLYGVGNILSLTEIISEADNCEQSTLEAKLDSNCRSKIRNRRVTARPIAEPIKHKLVQDKLTTQLMRQSNIVKPNADDIRIAKNRAETELKRADLEYEKQQRYAETHARVRSHRRRTSENPTEDATGAL